MRVLTSCAALAAVLATAPACTPSSADSQEGPSGGGALASGDDLVALEHTLAGWWLDGQPADDLMPTQYFESQPVGIQWGDQDISNLPDAVTQMFHTIEDSGDVAEAYAAQHDGEVIYVVTRFDSSTGSGQCADDGLYLYQQLMLFDADANLVTTGTVGRCLDQGDYSTVPGQDLAWSDAGS
jgi:hypothetical protein